MTSCSQAQRSGRLGARTRAAAWLVALLGAVSLPAQTRAEKIAAATGPWLAGDQTSREQLDTVVKVLLEEPKEGIEWLKAQLPEANATPSSPRSKGVQGLISHLALEFMRSQRATGITFPGQYSALLPLQPAVGEFLFGLLLETPEWYPLTHRIHLVPVLRDLQPRLPESARADAVVRLVENELEQENLRRALAALLWQWGTKQHAQRFVAALVTATGEGDAEDRVQTTLELADFQCQLREYKQAALTHRSAQTLAKTAGVTLKPVAWYAAACVHALLGDTERGLAAIEQCADMLASPNLDSSLRLSRTMFDTDPELATLRSQVLWDELMRRAFPATKAPPSGR